MWAFDAQRVQANVQQASTEDLLDRITAYRAGLEPAAIALIEEELQRRGVTAAQIAAHAQTRQDCLYDAAGVALTCSRCSRPAVVAAWGWHRLWGVVPLFPRRFPYCAVHQPGSPGAQTAGSG